MTPCAYKGCDKPGTYGNPSWPISDEFPLTDILIRRARWCEEHRTESNNPRYNDILLEDEDERDTTDTRQNS